MINLNKNTAKLQAILDASVTTTEIPSVVSYTELPANSQNTVTKSLNGTNAVDICGPSVYNNTRRIETIHIVNLDSVAATITIQYTDDKISYIIGKYTLDAGDHLFYEDNSGWYALDSTGKKKEQSSGGPGVVTDVNIVSSIELEVKNDAGNPLPVKDATVADSLQDIIDNGITINNIPTPENPVSDTQKFDELREMVAELMNDFEYIKKSMDYSERMPVYVKDVDGTLKKDNNNALILSDATDRIFGKDTQIGGSYFFIDTTGYKSAYIDFSGNAQMVVQSSNDGINWFTQPILRVDSIATNVTSGSTVTSGIYGCPCTLKYMRAVPSSAGTSRCHVILRNIEFAWGFFQSVIPVSIGGTVNEYSDQATSAGATSLGTGSVVVAGSNSSTEGRAIAPRPVLIGAYEVATPSSKTGRVRYLRLDPKGNLLVASADGVNTSPLTSKYNTPKITVEDVADFEGNSQIELLMQILKQLKIMNVMLSELPITLQSANGFNINIDELIETI